MILLTLRARFRAAAEASRQRSLLAWEIGARVGFSKPEPIDRVLKRLDRARDQSAARASGKQMTPTEIVDVLEAMARRSERLVRRRTEKRA